MLLTGAVNAQEKKESNQPLTVVDKQAEFKGGIEELVKYIQGNLQYPDDAKKNGVGGRCFIKFIVNEDGSISNTEVLKGVEGCKDCDIEAVRVVNSMPNWTPAEKDSKKVKCYYNLPIMFKA